MSAAAEPRELQTPTVQIRYPRPIFRRAKISLAKWGIGRRGSKPCAAIVKTPSSCVAWKRALRSVAPPARLGEAGRGRSAVNQSALPLGSLRTCVRGSPSWTPHGCLSGRSCANGGAIASSYANEASFSSSRITGMPVF